MAARDPNQFYVWFKLRKGRSLGLPRSKYRQYVGPFGNHTSPAARKTAFAKLRELRDSMMCSDLGVIVGDREYKPIHARRPLVGAANYKRAKSKPAKVKYDPMLVLTGYVAAEPIYCKDCGDSIEKDCRCYCWAGAPN
jgi:hypothetical protein